MKSLVIVMALVFVLAVSADEFLDQLQATLNAERGAWTADQTFVSQMNLIEQEKLFALLPNVPDVEDVIEVSREELRGSYVTEHTAIRDQASCGSCYSFGACAAYEGFQKKRGATYDLSEQYFMMKAKALDGSGYGGCNGWYLDTSMNLLKNYGVTSESCCPYKGYEAACPSTCSPTYKISSFSSTTDLNTIKNALVNYGPVYCGFAVYNDFTYYSSGIYKYTSGSLRGYHAVAIVGYDDDNKCFKVKNSWGPGWGESGYFRIYYSEMNTVTKFGTCFGGCFYVTK